jgi:tRNASer (uridine44-2'-O)-methyltransferase
VAGVHDLNQPIAEMKLSTIDGPGPKSGSLAKSKSGSKQPSAYQALTTYVTGLAEELGFDVQHEMLRIPSTRNAAIVGKVCSTHPTQLEGPEPRLERVIGIVKREVGEMERVVKDWLFQAEKISKKSSGH